MKNIRPQLPSYADFLRQDWELINEKNRGFSEYKSRVISEVSKVSGVTDLESMVLFLAENNYDKFRINKKQGRVRKWTLELEVMLAAYIKTRPRGVTIVADIEHLIANTIWGKLVEKNHSSQDFAGMATFEKHYKSGIKHHEMVEYELHQIDENPAKWASRLKALIL